MACQGFSATTPTKFLRVTTLTRPGMSLHGAFVDADQRGADGGRTHHAAVQHSGKAHVVDVLELAGDHGRHVGTADGLAEDGPLAGGFALGLLIEREVEFLAADQLAVGDFFRRDRFSR